MKGNLGRIVIGFIVGAVAVFVAHQGIIWLLPKTGLFPPPPVPVPPARAPAGPWSLEQFMWRIGPWPLFPVPRVVNSMFWGGVWGSVYGLVFSRLPGPSVVKGIIFGLIGPILIGGWLLVPYFTGRPYFGDYATHQSLMRLVPGLLINGAYGIFAAVLYHLLRRE